MTEQALPAHSPLGASSAERWMNCPGSVPLTKSIAKLVDAADPEYRVDGTAAHDAVATCLGSGYDAWEVIGQEFGDPKTPVTVEMADAIQVFLDECNTVSDGATNEYVEAQLQDPDHPMMFGTIDFGCLKDMTLFVRDFKYGMGIVVETKDNQQMMYYAYLLLLKHPDARRVNMRIIQPRIVYAKDEAWEVDAEYIIEWANKTLFPAMERTTSDTTLKPGEHCRFCDAKESLACPALKSAFAKLANADATVNQYADGTLLADWELASPVKMHIKALEGEVMRRLMAGQMKDNGVVKLVNKKADRVWKPEAPALFKSRFGDKSMSQPELLTPAQMEKIDPIAKKLVHEYAYTPQSGYTVAALDDKRPAVTVQTATEVFAAALTEAAA